MIRLTRLNLVSLVVNAELIEHIEMTPDTVISLTTGQKFMVRETADEVVDRVIQYRQAILSGMPFFGGTGAPRESAHQTECPTRLLADGK